MNKPLVRKFQPPGTRDPVASGAAPLAPHASPQAAAAHEPAVSHVEIPEINTDFIDNLWQDPSFVDRFDAGFDKTVPMGLDSAEPLSKQRTAEPESKNLLDFDFQGQPDKKNG